MSLTACSRYLTLAGLSATAACAAAPFATRSLAPPAGPSAVLLENEIARTSVGTAYQLIEQLRPEYFTVIRGSTDQIVIHVDGIRVGGIETLHTIPSNTIREIRRLSPSDATLRFGTGYSSGAILILIKSGRLGGGSILTQGRSSFAYRHLGPIVTRASLVVDVSGRD